MNTHPCFLEELWYFKEKPENRTDRESKTRPRRTTPTFRLGGTYLHRSVESWVPKVYSVEAILLMSSAASETDVPLGFLTGEES